MIRLASAILALALLAGCGASPTAAPKKAAAKSSPAAAAKSSSPALIDKGLAGLFTIAHGQLDEDNDGKLNEKEFAEAIEQDLLPGLPAFAAFDKNKDKQLTLAEFTDKAILKGKGTIFTTRVGREFAELDANKDKSLTAAELEETEMPFAAMDKDKNKKVSAAEFEAAYADAVSKPAK